MRQGCIRRDIFILAALFLFVSILCFAAETSTVCAKRSLSGEVLFRQYCSQCHMAGENLVKPGRPVAGSPQLSSLAVFKAYLKAPPGHMRSYGEVVNDREMLKALYDYCKSLNPDASKISIDTNYLR